MKIKIENRWAMRLPPADVASSPGEQSVDPERHKGVAQAVP